MSVTGLVTYFELHGIEHHVKYNGFSEFMFESIYYAGGLFLVWAFMRKNEK